MYACIHSVRKRKKRAKERDNGKKEREIKERNREN